MGIEATVIEPYWNYLLAIERDVSELSRYVEFDEKNFACFSIEIARILLSCGAEVDVVCKGVCSAINPQCGADNIHAYRTEIKKKYPNISKFEVTISRYGLILTPWDEWKKADGVPQWWTGYNKVKHERHTQFDKANLKNALNSLAGLFVMAVHLMDASGYNDFVTCPLLLGIHHGGHVAGRQFGGAESRVKFRL